MVTYGKIAKLLHWTIAFFIILNLVLGLTLDQTSWYDLHKQLGVTIIFLVIARLVWRLTSKYPAMLDSLAPHEKLLAHIGHGLLYILMLIMPLSGILMSNSFGRPVTFLGLPLPSLISSQPPNIAELYYKAHQYLAYIFILLIVLHIVAALKHHIIDKNDILLRMLPFSRRR